MQHQQVRLALGGVDPQFFDLAQHLVAVGRSRHLVEPVEHQQPGVGAEPGAQIIGRDRAARPLPDQGGDVLEERNIGLFAQCRGQVAQHDAHREAPGPWQLQAAGLAVAFDAAQRVADLGGKQVRALFQ